MECWKPGKMLIVKIVKYEEVAYVFFKKKKEGR